MRDPFEEQEKTPNDWSPLHVAIFRQHINAAKAIAQKKGSVRKEDERSDFELATIDILECSDKVQVDFTSLHNRDFSDSLGWTVVHVTALLGQAKLLQYILETLSAVIMDIPDANGMTALHWVAGAGRQNIVALLLSLGADPYTEDNWGRVPADIAAGESRVEIIKLLNSGEMGIYNTRSILSYGVNCASWRVCDSCDYVFRHGDLFLRTQAFPCFCFSYLNDSL